MRALDRKPTVKILQYERDACLPARRILASLKAGSSLHEKRDWRHPLGVYNTSIYRISRKIENCGKRLEVYWADYNSLESIREDIIDYLELVIYAAAEHVDDVEIIAATFFENDRDAAKSNYVRNLKKDVKPIRNDISNIANTIKHALGRIRLTETYFEHDGKECRFLGFFIEGFKNGSVSASTIIHSENKRILSVTSFLWRIVIYLSLMSSRLEDFLLSMNVYEDKNIGSLPVGELEKVAIILSKLPFYSLDDENPFAQTRLVLQLGHAADFSNSVYGSAFNKWSDSDEGRLIKTNSYFNGDGISNKFELTIPGSISLNRLG